MKKTLLLAAFFSLNFCAVSNAQLGALKGAVGKVKGVADEPHQGITSPSHTKYMGKIVFSATEEGIAFQKENEAQFASAFTLGQPIYFRMYTDNSLSNLAQKLTPTTSREVVNTHAQYSVKFYLDGALAYTGAIQADEMQEEQKKWTTFKGALQPADDKIMLATNLFKGFITENEAKLTNGAHKVRMDIAPEIQYPNQAEGKVIATGEFTLNVTATSIDPNNEKMCLPKAGMTDPKLEASILQAFKTHASKNGWTEVAKSARIISPQWNIIRHEITGLPLQRKVSAIIVSTTKAGKCIYQDFGFFQDHDGNNYQQNIYLLGVGDQREVNCKCIK